jgi:hypothetical protein
MRVDRIFQLFNDSEFSDQGKTVFLRVGSGRKSEVILKGESEKG